MILPDPGPRAADFVGDPPSRTSRASWRLRAPRFTRRPWTLTWLLERFPLPLFAFRDGAKEAPTQDPLDEADRWWMHRGSAAVVHLRRAIRGTRCPDDWRAFRSQGFATPHEENLDGETRDGEALVGLCLAAIVLEEAPSARLAGAVSAALSRVASVASLSASVRTIARGIAGCGLRMEVPSSARGHRGNVTFGTADQPLLEAAGVTWLSRCLEQAGLGPRERDASPRPFEEAVRALLLDVLHDTPNTAAHRWEWFQGRYPWSGGDEFLMSAWPENLGFACLRAMEVPARRSQAQRALVGFLLHRRRVAAEASAERERGRERVSGWPGWSPTCDDVLAALMERTDLETGVRALATRLFRFPESAGSEDVLRVFYTALDAPAGTPSRVNVGVRPADLRALAEYQEALRRNPALENGSLKDIYGDVREHADRRIPKFDSWRRQLGRARQDPVAPLRASRSGREGRSVRRAEELL